MKTSFKNVFFLGLTVLSLGFASLYSPESPSTVGSPWNLSNSGFNPRASRFAVNPGMRSRMMMNQRMRMQMRYRAGAGSRVGQMPIQFHPMYRASYISNWRGTQPMGASYMPPIGMSAVTNKMYYNRAKKASSALGYPTPN